MAGDCVPFTVTTVSSIGAAAPADENLDLGFMQSGPAATVHSDAACSQPLGVTEIPVNQSTATLYVRSTGVGMLQLTATHSDLLISAPLIITLGPPVQDGGSDAGAAGEDAGLDAGGGEAGPDAGGEDAG